MRFLDAEAAVAEIPHGATVTLSANGGGMLEPDRVLAALRARFESTSGPRDLTLVHALGLGDGVHRGTNAVALEGLVSTVIGGHWTWSPEMVRMANENRIAAYALPAGVISLLLREIGARRPGLLTRTGLGTFVDPRQAGGACNARARQRSLVEVVEFDGDEYLRYRPFPVDVAIIRAEAVDPAGNLSCAREAGVLDVLAAATAARASGGRVIAQVKRRIDTVHEPHLVHVPAPLVDVVVLSPTQWQTYAGEFDPAFCATSAEAHIVPKFTDPVRTLIALRAGQEVRAGSLLNVGFGMSSLVVDALTSQGRMDDVTLAIEQGMIGGVPVSGDLFGAVRSPAVVQPSTTQFDLFASGVLDMACLGMAQADADGNVNVSRINGSVIGPGGFVDIAQNAAEAVFCGTFTAKGLRVGFQDSRIRILEEGSVPKFVAQVEEITHSGRLAVAEGRQVTFVTERAVLKLRSEGVELVEVAPGIDIRTDVIEHMGFTPLVRNVKPMDAGLIAAAQSLTAGAA
ncbi:MAG: CoA-transferase [Nocardioides sp.]|uniref:CoA-transferase n=1 Tax=Nocardioides sp. TaxID=35761 RepID=UPI0039E2B430